MKHSKQSGQGKVIDAALAKIGASPLVGLAEEIPRIHMDNSYPMSKDDWGYVTSTGHIFLNPCKDGTIGEWTYVLAHLMLHLGLGHLREDRMNVCLPNMAIPVEEQYLTNMPLFSSEKRNAAMLEIEWRITMLISTKKHIYF